MPPLLSLYLFHLNDCNIFSVYKSCFHDLRDAWKNCFYYMMFSSYIKVEVSTNILPNVPYISSPALSLYPS